MKHKMHHRPMGHGARGHPEHIGFDALANKVSREYQRKGYSKRTADLYGKETAAKVLHEKQHSKRGF